MPTRKNSKVKKPRVHYEPAQQSALEYTFRKDRDNLEFRNNMKLTQLAIELDELVIVKRMNVPISEPFGAIFRKYNIFEFKSPTGPEDIHVYNDLCTYMHRFLHTQRDVDWLEITGTLYRHAYPESLFKDIIRLGGRIEMAFKGIYYVHELSPFPTQVIVGIELDEERYAIWKLLSANPTVEDMRRFLSAYQKEMQPEGMREKVDSVIQVCVENSEQVREYLREDKLMSEELKRILGYDEEMRVREKASEEKGKVEGKAEGKAEGKVEGKADSLKSLMENLNCTLKRAMELLSIPADQEATYAKLVEA